MIRYEMVTGFDGAQDAAEHHAKSMLPFMREFLFHLPGTLGVGGDEWLVKQSRKGGRSWSIVSPSGQAFHLRPFDYHGADARPWIGVYDAARNGNLRMKINHPDAVLSFLRIIERAHRNGEPVWEPDEVFA